MLKIVVLLVSVSAALGAWQRPGLQSNISTHPGAKIINGVQANEGQFPYLVSLNYQGDGHACGASILTADWVLTAAHCCLTGSAMEIYAGSIYLSNGGQKYPISQLLYHGDYDPNNHWVNDICVIKMASPIQLGANAQQVKLPSQGMDVPPSADLTIPGWGVDQNGNGPDRLQVLNNDHALTKADCIAKTGVQFIDGQLCTYHSDMHAVCSGDSGGPLTMNGVQVGITSWVWLPCGGTGMPDVFTKVPQYVDWIQYVLGSAAKDLKFATAEDFL